ncbi:MAG: YifB family Mg chelatase-like AAA ATPase [Candidatus Poribacteria bacterium]|nr:YifB family Mg chelatase-like AAA ATPase [Candidatus Poribacteria bacterium]MDE0322807.1 YifB family Mg chelatase-like AAA ATPase [Candidatus Poribacteria bacterium]
MLATVLSSAMLGIDAYIVKVEVDVAGGMPYFSTVGLPDSAIKESRDRVTAAIKNSGFYFPPTRITANLAPADIRKAGSAFDLPIAIGVMAATNQVSLESLENTMILGELALDGSIRGIPGGLPIAITAKENNIQNLILPAENAREAAIVEDVNVYPVASLSEAAAFLNSEKEIVPEPHTLNTDEDTEASEPLLDLLDVKGQEHVKRAIEVAAAGGHNLIMIGPPGSGKTMIAKRIPSILPRLSIDESLETTKIQSTIGILPSDTPLVVTRPYRSPHHTISDAGLIGGGKMPRPGEVSLAHNGVLFLDELPEFRRNVLEVMRQPLEDRQVTISRASASLTYPANFMLVAAMNPCPCGFFSDPSRDCKCSPNQIQNYVSRISGPLLDRIDIQVEVPAVKHAELAAETTGETSAHVQERVEAARQVQHQRFAGTTIHANANMESKQIREYCKVDDQAQDLLRVAINQLGLSARAYDRILKVARTIADLDRNPNIEAMHVSEAIQYRSLDRSFWKE